MDVFSHLTDATRHLHFSFPLQQHLISDKRKWWWILFSFFGWNTIWSQQQSAEYITLYHSHLWLDPQQWLCADFSCGSWLKHSCVISSSTTTPVLTWTLFDLVMPRAQACHCPKQITNSQCGKNNVLKDYVYMTHHLQQYLFLCCLTKASWSRNTDTSEPGCERTCSSSCCCSRAPVE